MSTLDDKAKEKAKRKRNARRSDAVIAAIQERLLAMPLPDQFDSHRARLMELFDELIRSLGKGSDDE